jgi:GNAT superfamily N-acetyltransferase
VEDAVEPVLVVRRAQWADHALLVEFNAAMARETEGRELDPERLARGTRAVLEAPERGFYVVAEDAGGFSGGALGALLVTREWSDWRDGWFWWIQSVYVRPEGRRRGVYRAMHRWLEAQARAQGDPLDGRTVVGLRLYVERHNERAMATYRALGMEQAHYQLFETDFVLPRPDGPRESRPRP